MIQPTSATTLARPELGAVAYEYVQGSSGLGFIGLEVMPLFGVPRDTGEYPVIPAEYLLNIEDTRRAASGNYNRGSWQFETATYACIEYGWEEPVDDKAANMYRTYFDAEMVSTEIATDVLLRGHEKRVADTLFNTSNAIGNAAVTTEWSTITATPKADVNSGIQAMRAASGIMPNALVMSRKVFENVLVTTELKDYLQYTTPHLVEGEEAQRATLARYFGVERVLVGGAVQNTAKEGQAFAAGDLWDDEYVSLCRLSGGGNNLREPVFGRTFLWEEDAPDVIVTETYRDEPVRATIVRVRQNVDEAIQYTGANYLLTNITA